MPISTARHARTFATVLLPLAVALAAANFALDPFAAHRVVQIDALAPYRDELVSRVAKAEILAHGPCEVAILGTSRAQIALDPGHATWPGRGCNLSLTGVGARELELVLGRAVDTPGVRHVVLELEFGSFDATNELHPEIRLSRFNPDLDVFEYHASLLLGAHATRGSWRMLSDWRRDRRAPYDERGLTDPGLRPRRDSPRERFVWSLERTVRALRPPAFRYDTDAPLRLARAVALARERAVDVTLVILPTHALGLEAVARLGRFDAYERWKRDLVLALAAEDGARDIPLWDFTAFDGPSAEPVPESADAEMRWHWDAVHVRRALGDRVVLELFGGAPRDAELAVARLEPASVDQALERVRRARERWVAANAADLAILEQVLGASP